MNTRKQHTKIFKLKPVVALVFFFSAHLFIAQNIVTKLNKEFSFLKNKIQLQMDASYTQIVFKNWDKNKIGINAYITGDLPTIELEKQTELWNLKLNHSDSLLSVLSKVMPVVNKNVVTQYSVSGNVPANQLAVMMKQVLSPILQNLQNNPIPDQLKEQLSTLHFDFEAYKKLGDTYLKMWESSMVKNIDKESTIALRKWSKDAASNLTNVSQRGLTINNPQINQKQSRGYQVSFSQSYSIAPSVKTEKILEISMPLYADLKLMTRYGTVDVINELADAKAEMKYTSFRATKISGNGTQLQISFAPILIDQWNSGELILNYVKQSEINSVQNIRLSINSSKIKINKLQANGIFKSSFGTINLVAVENNFSQLSFLLENSDLLLSLPKTAFNFAYSGSRSYIQVPENRLKLTSLASYGNQMLNGYALSRNTEKEVQLSVDNSQVLLR